MDAPEPPQNPSVVLAALLVGMQVRGQFALILMIDVSMSNAVVVFLFLACVWCGVRICPIRRSFIHINGS
jgi:hypothetical protein